MLGEKTTPRIGIAWQGNPKYEADHQRSIPLVELTPLLAFSEVQFVSLQQGVGLEQVSDIDAEILSFGEEVDQSAAFVDSAAIMVNLDLVITSDTALPHLAGALGVPVWLMLPKTPDWRWLLDRADSPYYSTMRLFRQEVANEWPGVIKQVIDALGQETLF
jgi:hypothetical protein